MWLGRPAAGWETKTPLPDGSPYRYHVPSHLPVIEQFVAATTAAGIGHGFYYSLVTDRCTTETTTPTTPPVVVQPHLTCLSCAYRQTNNFYLNVGGHKARGSAVRCIPRLDAFDAVVAAKNPGQYGLCGQLTMGIPPQGCMPGQACVTQAQYETLALAQVKQRALTPCSARVS